MPSASQRDRRSRAAVSPGGNGSAASGAGPLGISPAASPGGTVSARGAPWTSRRGSCSQARQNGLKTTNGLPCFVAGLPTSAMKLPGWRRTWATPSSAAVTRRSRAIANGDTSEAKWTVSAPTSRAIRGRTFSGRPARTNSWPPRSRSAARSSRSDSSMNHARLRDGKRPASSSRGSSTNSGTTCSASLCAAVSAG